MKFIHKTIFVLALIMSASVSRAQTDTPDAFAPIGKYISQGNAEALSAWFADNLEVSVLSEGDMASRSQAKQVMKTFFDSYNPRSFEVTYTAGRANMKYALGSLNAGGENFLVTIFISCKNNAYHIQQLKIERRR